MMQNNTYTVIILGCGTQGLAIVRSLAKEGHRVILLYSDKHNYADMSRYVSKKILYTCKSSSPDFLALLINVIQENHADTIIPMGDVLAEMLSKNKDVLSKYVSFLMPSYDVFARAYDKNQLMSVCKKNGYPHPFTLTDITDISNLSASDLSFPLLIKPNITCGARGMTLVQSFEELQAKYPLIRTEYGPCHLQQYVKQGGAQVEFQLFINEKQELVCSSVIYKYRWYPIKGGSSCCAVSARNDKMVQTLYSLLKEIGWVGFADFDTIEDPDTGELLIMELNPRVPACVKTAIAAGINWGQIIVDGYMRQPQRHYLYKEGEYLRHLGFEILWFLKSPSRFRTRPNWFHLFGSKIHFQDMSDWTDPLPFLAGTFNNLKKVLSHTDKQKLSR